MRDAETVLGIIRERGKQGKPLEDVYRQLFNPALYLMAYGKVGRNQGAMTPGSTDETVDGMSQSKIDAIIEAVRFERYRWTPVRRTYIEKKNSTRKRPLGIPTWSDKLLQEVIRLILNAYFEPQFSEPSHGFRPKRGCHSALTTIDRTCKGTVWFIEGDITACFDSLDHEILLSVLRQNVHDERFIRLISELLKAGYLENWKYNATYSGTPQGGIVSPILANIYLDQLDKYVEQYILPYHNQGARRQHSLLYHALQKKAGKLVSKGHREEAQQIRKAMHAIPSVELDDPNYRRLRYTRYADDFLFGFTGPKSEVEEIKGDIGTFLRDHLKLELSDSKTLITHGRTKPARFLGYDIQVGQRDTYRDALGRRSLNGRITLQVPSGVVQQWCQRYTHNGKPVHRAELINDSEYDIIAKFQSEYRGLVEYYKLAGNRGSRMMRLYWTMDQALFKTLASKLRISVAKVARRRVIVHTATGPRKMLQAVIPREGKKPLIAQWGYISLRNVSTRATLTLKDEQPTFARWGSQRTELVQRLLADTCELCGSQENVQVHHIRHMRDLNRPGQAEKPLWVQVMAARRRKTLVLCHACHMGVHAGDPHRKRRTAGEPDALKGARPVRRGADGKVPA